MINKKIPIVFFFLLFLFIFVSAQPPFQTSPQEAGYLIIETAHAGYHKTGTDFYVHAHVYNGDDGVLLTTNVDYCKYRFYQHGIGGDEHISKGNLSLYGDGFSTIVNGSLINKAGEYSVLIWCYEDGGDAKGGFYQYSFHVTPSGVYLQQGTSGIYISLLFILVIFLVLTMTSFVKFDNLLNRVGMIGLSYLLLLAISFISWNMASDFLTSAPFIIEMFRIIFWVLIVIAFPLLIGGFVWYLLMLFKIKEIQDLMNKGMDFNEAEHRVKRRRRYR